MQESWVERSFSRDRVHRVHEVHRVHKVRGCTRCTRCTYHPEFARFARIAKSSEQEVLNHLYRARNRNYITPAEFEDAAWAARKALKAVNGLIRYLDDTPGFGKK